MLIISLCMFVGFVLLYKGGDFLVEGAAGISSKKNIPAFIIGITLVAFGTSAPELFFNIISALRGHAEFALSNVAGSNLANLCIGIGVSAIISNLAIKRIKFKKDLIFLVLGPVSVLILVLISKNNSLNISHGFILLFGFGFYIYLTKRVLSSCNSERPKDSINNGHSSCKKEWAIFFAGCLMLYLGGEIVFRNALSIVSECQVSESIVGLTIIAFGTSIPDCTASIIATVKRHKDIAVGNIIGSNIFNIFLVLGVTLISYNKTISFHKSHLYDFLSISLLSFLFFTYVLMKQSCNRYFGLIIFLYYPLSLLIRIKFFLS